MLFYNFGIDKNHSKEDGDDLNVNKYEFSIFPILFKCVYNAPDTNGCKKLKAQDPDGTSCQTYLNISNFMKIQEFLGS